MTWGQCNKTLHLMVFTELAPRPFQSISCDVRVLSVVPSVHVFFESIITPIYKGPRTE